MAYPNVPKEKGQPMARESTINSELLQLFPTSSFLMLDPGSWYLTRGLTALSKPSHV